MSFKPENELEEALMRAARDSAERPLFYRVMETATLYFVNEGAPPEGGKLATGQTLNIRQVQFDGKQFVPVFTSPERIAAAFPEGQAYLGMAAKEFFDLTRGAKFLLNPGSEFGKEITPLEAASIADGTVGKPEEIFVPEAPAQVLLGKPAVYPQALADALSRLFEKDGRVTRAWIAHFFNPLSGEKAHTLVALEAGEHFQAVLHEAGSVVAGVEVPEPPVDFLPIGRGGELEEYFLEDCEPFYKAKS
ncbi:MAG: hypothetical protein CO113_13790 [Elusimicrobia bacterium CG_4_9_14_3_um_filter_62_55]|nr:MAG: hypothetical protein COR54_12105 [Elusimicrobia bacterium CG22_combo_CG10-13_8_21_14_all_63_91]PJA13224.1 MAG: hypothetical protein COX66_15330 [Elusimicrobia bacterium CG_4_10_14_0_2_um_filter_63_34]PJB24464.1 MAG: hypothetical protein CO113_13790 [Elusimicrobia bacterium CG_4_9_14_3_um_filter_62_55]